jgi:hypothetical protein
MDQHDSETTQRQRLLDAELIPLSVAAQVAYFQLTGVIDQTRADDGLAEMVQLAALALSQVAPILRQNGDALTTQEVGELFVAPRAENFQPVDLDAFLIRRGDFRAALSTLQEARAAFGRKNDR